MPTLLHSTILFLAWATLAAQESKPTPAKDAPPAAKGGQGRKITIGPDDKAAFADAPAEAFKVRKDIPHGKLEFVEYDSKSVGTRRRMQVYTPPGFDAAKPCPVLYLLHGIGGDDKEWQRFATIDALMDNLIADGKAVPMIIVMPNGRAQKDDRAIGNVYAGAPAFAAFERDLLDDVIPFIENRYKAKPMREQRALAGLSMGGGQTLNFGFGHPETFASLGAFSAAPNSKAPAALLPDASLAQKYKVLWVSCGNKDSLLAISQGVHERLKTQQINHTWHVDDHGHDGAHWRSALYWFSQKLFK